MKELKDAKNIYDHIVVPEELDLRLRNTLASAEPQKKPKNKILTFGKWAASAAAVLFLCFTIGLNTSETFAMEAASLPLIGQIAKVLTVRYYEKTEDIATTSVTVPEVHLKTKDDGLSRAVTDVNKKIDELVKDFTHQKEMEIKEYKDAFFEEGGTKEEWNARSIDINVNYEVKHQSDHYLSLMIDSWISWFNFEEERHFYNLDLITGKELSLTDLLGEDAYEHATEAVLNQMKERISQDPENCIFWGINDADITDEFAGVTEETSFYLNDSGNVVISYDKYEVAPGYMGIQEFEISGK